MTRRLLFIVAIGLWLVACGGPPASGELPAENDGGEDVGPTEAPVEEPTMVLVDVESTEAPVGGESTEVPTENPAGGEATEEPPEVEPTPDIGPPPNRGDRLHATDPATVSLASGAPQLVEIMAFW